MPQVSWSSSSRLCWLAADSLSSAIAAARAAEAAPGAASAGASAAAAAARAAPSSAARRPLRARAPARARPPPAQLPAPRAQLPADTGRGTERAGEGEIRGLWDVNRRRAARGEPWNPSQPRASAPRRSLNAAACRCQILRVFIFGSQATRCSIATCWRAL